jgi:quercetin dioxygenase-like cupin family protein
MWKCWVTIVPPGVTLEPHKHPDHEQVYYILEGSAEVSVGDEKQQVSAGDCIYMPTDVFHGLVNNSDTECKLFTVGANIFRAYMTPED